MIQLIYYLCFGLLNEERAGGRDAHVTRRQNEQGGVARSQVTQNMWQGVSVVGGGEMNDWWMTEVWIFVANESIHLHQPCVRLRCFSLWARCVNSPVEISTQHKNSIQPQISSKRLRSFSTNYTTATSNKSAIGDCLGITQHGHLALCKIWNASSSHFTG